MKVYIITAGTYSDYHICAVATDPISAENLRIIHSDSWCGAARVEIFDTQEVPDRPKTCWEIWVDDCGAVGCREKVMDTEQYINCVTYACDIYSVDVIADDKEHAKKIALDLIAQYKYEHKVERGKAE